MKNRSLVFMLVLLGALIAFEAFNYSTSEYSLRSILGDLSFIGIPWAVLLAVAFCSADFAGIARIFTPQKGKDEPREVWVLFAAWIMAATMNAVLTWWGVTNAMINQGISGNEVVSRDTLLLWVPMFLAALVWLLRLSLIVTFVLAAENGEFRLPAIKAPFKSPQLIKDVRP